MIEKHDVLIVGAGTGGAVAARTMALKGLDVCLIDRKSEKGIGRKVCGDAVPAYYFDKFREIGLMPPKSDEVERRIEGLKLHSPDKSLVYTVTGPHMAGYTLNRHLFGQRVLHLALDAGARLIDKTTVLRPIIRENFFAGVEVRRPGRGKWVLNGEIIVDASGASGVLRKMNPLNHGMEKEISKRDLFVSYREIRRLRAEVEEPQFVKIFWNREVAPGSYYWIFPEFSTKTNVGVGVQLSCRGANPKKQLYTHVLKGESFRGSEIVHVGAGVVPTRRPNDTLVDNGLMLVGDAGFQVNPLHGGGIGPSMLGGYIAGKVASDAIEKGRHDQKSLWVYNREFMKAYGHKQAVLDVFRSFINSLTNEDVNYVMKQGLISEEDVIRANAGERVTLAMPEKMRRVFKGLGKMRLLKKLYATTKNMNEARRLYIEYTSLKEHPSWKKRSRMFFRRLRG